MSPGGSDPDARAEGSPRAARAGNGSEPEPAADRLGEIGELLRSALQELERMRDAGLQMARVHADKARVGARRAAFTVALLAVGGLVGLAALATAGVLLVRGLAGGLSWALGSAEWVGSLLAGLLLVGGVLAAILVARRSTMRELGRELERKYETGDGAARRGKEGEEA